jgi:hypothetical protein
LGSFRGYSKNRQHRKQEQSGENGRLPFGKIDGKNAMFHGSKNAAHGQK